MNYTIYDTETTGLQYRYDYALTFPQKHLIKILIL